MANAYAQVGYGPPVFKQDFGTGNNDPATIGIPFAPSKSDFTFSNSVCPPPGSYTIIRRIPVASCFNNEWIPLSHDNNPESSFGMMMVVNNNPDAVKRTIYKDTVTASLCPGELYFCSAFLINLDTMGICPGGPDFPVIEFRVETESGILLTKDTTRPALSYSSSVPFGYRFTDIGIYFIMPPGVSKLIVKLTLLPGTYACAEDFAVDAIEIKSVGPAVAIGFSDEPNTTIIKTVCFQDNRTILLNGNMDIYYSNPVLQWQQSLDSGTTWTDISRANATTYTRNYTVPGLFFFRLSGGDATTIANPYCRVISNVVRVRVDGLPSQYYITNNSPVCAGQDLKFRAEGAATYIWRGPNGFYDNINAPHIFFSQLSDSGTYYVDVYSLGGCKVRDSTKVTIIGTDVHAGPDTAICKGRSVNLYASKGTSYAWSPAEELSGTAIINPVAKPAETTVYTVKVTDIYGCSDTAQVKIVVRNKNEVKAEFMSNDFLCRSADSIYFTNQSTGDIKTWQWNFGNGLVSDVKDPPVQQYQILSNSNNFKVQLVVMDKTGCADTTYKNLKAVDNCYIAVPNAFTPNGDGLNDYLYPLNAYKVTNLLFSVYNRLGQLVFKTSDWTKKWDGTLGGVQQEPGAYVWVLQYYDAAGKKISLKGTTVLIR